MTDDPPPAAPDRVPVPSEPRSRVPIASLLSANAVSLTGNVITLLAVPWFVLQTTGSAARTGLTAFAALLPIVLSGLFGGALIDRLGFRRTSVLSDLASAAAVAAIPLFHTTVGLEFWQLLVLVFLAGLLDAPGETARSSLVPDAASRAGWPTERATGAWAVVERGSRLAGGPLAGGLIALVGAANALWVDAATFVVSAVLVSVGVPRPRSAPARSGRSYLGDLLEGYRFLGRDRTLRAIVVTVSITNSVDAVNLVALPVLADRVYGGALDLGWMVATMGAGSVLGALSFAALGSRLPRRHLFVWGFFLVGVSFPVAALYPPLWALLASRALLGVASGPLNPLIDAVKFERVPADMRGRVLGVVRASAWMAMPVGVLVGGGMIESVGLRWTLAGSGAVYVTVALACLLSPGIRGLDERPQYARAQAASSVASRPQTTQEPPGLSGSTGR